MWRSGFCTTCLCPVAVQDKDGDMPAGMGLEDRKKLRISLKKKGGGGPQVCHVSCPRPRCHVLPLVQASRTLSVDGSVRCVSGQAITCSCSMSEACLMRWPPSLG